MKEAAAEYASLVETGRESDLAVRRIRNRLAVESVSVVDGEGRYLHSSSPTRVGAALSGFLAGAVDRGVLGAIAEPLTHEVVIDGVIEWRPGDILYRVTAPLPGGSGALVVEYDMSELLARRAGQAALRPANLAAGAASLILAAGTALLLVARQGALRRATEAAMEKQYLERRSAELEEYNRELDQARAEAERALALAEETNRIRSEFVLMINHELRTPLTSIVTGAALLAEGWDRLSPGEREHLLTDVVADGRRLKELITQMLVVARIENRGLHYELRRVGLGQLRQRMESLSPRTGLWAGIPATPDLLTDADTLAQLLVSLSDNARTHGAAVVTIEVATELPFEPAVEAGSRPDPGIYFLVADDGPGIESGFLPHIFEKFEKRGRNSGTGLGLYLAKLMVEGIDGSISVISGPGGTTMAVGIPCWQPQQLQAAI
jgi:signal transduction histidine kinase